MQNYSKQTQNDHKEKGGGQGKSVQRDEKSYVLKGL